jgi:coenzyme F420-reducing hydrogenase beta subunit
MFGTLFDRILKKSWSDEELERYVGKTDGAWLSYAKEPEIRSVAASGGSTSALLCDLLERREIDGALVCGTKLVDGRVRANLYIATTAEQILEARGSKYVETPFVLEALPQIRDFDGRLAVTALPCDVSMLRRQMRKDADLERKVVLILGVVCGHNSRTTLIDATTRRLEREANSSLKRYRFRIGPWRGRLRAEFQDGTTLSKHSSYFNLYQNLFFFAERKCLACTDHFAYEADISVGDVWLFRLKDDPIKRTGLLARTSSGREMIERAASNDIIATESISPAAILDGQSRIAPFHHNVTARAKAGKLLGVKLKERPGQSVKIHEYLAALIVMANVRLSENEFGKRLILKTPKPLLRLYLYVLKGLESLK